MKAPLTTHILDTSRGRPADGVIVTLSRGTSVIARGVTDADGRIMQWDGAFDLEVSDYTLDFQVGSYFERRGEAAFYPDIRIRFHVDAPEEHYHVPLLLNPFGYSTYRGS